jgi:hypothetical protein
MTDPPDVDGFGTENITRADDFIDHDSGLEFKFQATHKDDAVPISQDGHSGYLFNIPHDKDKALDLFQKLYDSDFNKQFQKIAQANIDFVVYNVNYDTFSYVALEFYIDSVGLVTKTMRFTKCESFHFDVGNDNPIDQKKLYILIWEIIYLLFVAFETIKILTVLKDEWLFLSSLEIKPKYRL